MAAGDVVSILGSSGSGKLVEAEGPPDELFAGSTSERFRQFISKERG
jgi:ABC-type histidine transport system ATPase subunit